jgi:aspartate/methionine/tyrosine aminotransferase
MERWQSTYEHRVRYNLSESGVHPLSVSELLALAGRDPGTLAQIRLGYGQSNGSDELRSAIAGLYPGATDQNVLVTVGGAEANLACAWHLVEQGESLAVMLPNYMQVPGLASSFGARVHPFHLREEDGWRPDLPGLERALANGARVVLVTNPNNPTGRALTPAAMKRIAELVDRHGAWLLADEVYRGAEVQGEETPSFWGMAERVLVTHSLSKAYAIPGLRIGWVVGPAPVVASLWGRTDYTTIAPASLSDQLAVLALQQGTRARILQRTREIIRGNLVVLKAWLDERADLFRYTPPDAGAICMVRYEAPVGSAELAEKLRTDHDVLVVPGIHFGIESCVRLGFGPPRQFLEEALARVGEAFEAVLTRPGGTRAESVGPR